MKNNTLTTEELIGTVRDFQKHEYYKLIIGETDVHQYVDHLMDLYKWMKKVTVNNLVEDF